MKTNHDALTKLARQRGKVLEIVLVLAIVAVVFLLWQTGRFSFNNSSTPPIVESTPPAEETAPRSTPADSPSKAPVQSSPSEVKHLEPLVNEPTGKEPAAIVGLTDRLLRSHPVDFSACEQETDPFNALTCAETALDEALQAIFSDYEVLREQGDQTAKERGGEVIKRVTLALQAKIQKFEDAVK